MKKTYIIPEALIVVLGTCKMMAASDGTLSKNGDNFEGSLIDSNAGSAGLTKESKNVWDEEW